MTNYYTNERTTAQDFFNNVCMNFINSAKKHGEHSTRVTIYNLTVDKTEIARIAKECGFDVMGIKRAPRTLQFNW